MSKYLITYNLDDPADYSFHDITEAIYAFDESATNCFSNVWLVRTSATVKEIRESLAKHLGLGDRLVIAAVSEAEFAGFDRAITAWVSGVIDE